MIKKLTIGLMVTVLFSVTMAATGLSMFDGSLRTIPYDDSYGTRTYVDKNGVTQSGTGGRGVGFSVNYVLLSLKHKFSDNVSIVFEPYYESPTGANPVFGYGIGNVSATAGQGIYTGATLYSIQNWESALLIVTLGDGYTLSSGLMRSKLSWSFGDRLAWQDMLQDTRVAANSDDYVRDSGLMLQKTINVAGVDLPTTIQLLNGGSNFIDNNQNISTLVKVEPNLMGVKWECSWFSGMWDTAMANLDTRIALGAEYKSGPMTLRAEAIQGNQMNARGIMSQATSTANIAKWANASSYDSRISNTLYGVVHYQLLPNLDLEAMYSVLRINGLAGTGGLIAYDSVGSMETDTDIIYGMTYMVAENVPIYVNLQMSDYVRNDSSAPVAKTGTIYTREELSFNRLVIGSRINF